MRRQIVCVSMSLFCALAFSVQGMDKDTHQPANGITIGTVIGHSEMPARRSYDWAGLAWKILPSAVGVAGMVSGAYFFSQDGEYDCRTPIVCCFPGNPNNCGSPVIYAHQCEG